MVAREREKGDKGCNAQPLLYYKEQYILFGTLINPLNFIVLHFPPFMSPQTCWGGSGLPPFWPALSPPSLYGLRALSSVCSANPQLP